MSDTERLSAQLDSLAKQITALTESFNAQFRSLTASIHSNTVEISTRLTAIERDFAGHLSLDGSLHMGFEDKFRATEETTDELALQIGKEVGALSLRLEQHEKLVQQAKGAAVAWRIVLGCVGAVLAVLEFFHLGGGK